MDPPGWTHIDPPGCGRVNALQWADDGGGALPPSRLGAPTLEKEDAGDRAHPGGPMREPDRNQGQFCYARSTELCSVVKVNLFNLFSQTYLKFVVFKWSVVQKGSRFKSFLCFSLLVLPAFAPVLSRFQTSSGLNRNSRATDAFLSGVALLPTHTHTETLTHTHTYTHTQIFNNF